MADFDETVRARRCVRGFKSERVPEEVIREALELAQRAPSNCNVQPWRVWVASGAKRDELREALTSAFTTGSPAPDAELPIETFPGDYRRLQIECAVEMYGHMGVERGDHQGRMRAHLRNYELFDAPHVAIVCMDKHFGIGVSLDVGMWVQTFLLALWSRGVGSCPQAALRAYPSLIRKVLGIPDNLHVLCGVSFGYEDESVPANATRQTREPIDTNATFVE